MTSLAACGLGFSSTLPIAMIRTLMSKLVTPHEQGTRHEHGGLDKFIRNVAKN